MHTNWIPRRPAAAALTVSLTVMLVALAAARGATPEQTSEDAAAETPNPAYVTLLLARDSAVHEELGLDSKQQAAVMAAVAEVDHPLWVLRDVPVAQSAQKLDELRSTLASRLESILSPQQNERFNQLVIQARGAKALVSADVQQRLGLSEDQLAQLREIVAAAKGGALDSGKVLAVLTPQQRPKLGALFGPRFDTSRVTYVGCQAPELRDVDAWINAKPLSLERLRGNVVAVHFWAFNCSNCINNLPHYQSWHEKFPELTIIGIHTPETSVERSVDNLRRNVKMREIKYPVAVDGKAENWKAWGNNVWPAVYLIDKRGNVRAWWYGELNWQGAGGEEQMRKRIQELLAEK